ncbi:MAG: nitroreductase family protein [Longicatena sp.]
MLKDLIRKNRSYRGYDESRKISKEELLDMVDCARLTPSSVNRQPLKYVVVYETSHVQKIYPLIGWAKALKKAVPYEGHYPTAFIVIVQDLNIMPSLDKALKDVGIVAQTMLLRATEMELGGCMIGSFKKEELHEVLELDENLVPMLVIALGKPDETIVLSDVNDDQSTMYYRDDRDIHYVPKRVLEDIVIDSKEK